MLPSDGSDRYGFIIKESVASLFDTRSTTGVDTKDVFSFFTVTGVLSKVLRDLEESLGGTVGVVKLHT